MMKNNDIKKGKNKDNIKNNKILNYILVLFWVFIIGSVIGFIVEILYTIVYIGEIEIRKGLIYGPFIQVYGVGAMAYYILVSNVQKPSRAFFIGMVMGGVIEYFFSFFQEIIFGTVSWDYSNELFNINGRTSLTYTVYWGILAIVYLKLLYPVLQKLENTIAKKSIRIITYILIPFMIFNIWISSVSVMRQSQRQQNIEPQNELDRFLDKYYPDEFLDKIYHNKYDPSTL